MKQASQIIETVKKEGRNFLLEHEAKTICEHYKIPVTKFYVAQNLQQAIKFAEKIGYPVVLKIVSPDIIHKTDVGGVILNLKNKEEVKEAYNKIVENVKKHTPKAEIRGVIVQEMAEPSIEVIIGAVKDPQFGPALMFGLGGIFVELLKDVTYRIAPITREEAKEMVTEIKAYPLLEGYRGKPRMDIDAIIDVLLNTSRLIMENPEVKELDLNPILVYEKGAKTVDARILLEQN
jgi:acetyl-CoA synthetase (ADP-forming)